MWLRNSHFLLPVRIADLPGSNLGFYTPVYFEAVVCYFTPLQGLLPCECSYSRGDGLELPANRNLHGLLPP
jgi:hypothetical protein